MELGGKKTHIETEVRLLFVREWGNWVKAVKKYKLPIRRSVKAMATHSSTLAWKISWAEELGRLQSMGLRRVGHD